MTPPTLDLLTLGRLHTLELPDGRGPLTVIADHVQTDNTLVLDPEDDRPLGRAWRVELVCVDTEGMPERLGLLAIGGSVHTTNGWARILGLQAGLRWELRREGGRWRPVTDGHLTMTLLFPGG